VIAALAFLHNRLAIALLLFAVLLGLWGTIQFVRRRAVSPGFRSSYLLMIGLTAVQGTLGLLSFTAYRPRELLHVVYGIFAIAFLPAIFLYGPRGGRPREAAFLTTACWVVAIAFGRGIATGG
jgi:CDP-diglyceride synthetase